MDWTDAATGIVAAALSGTGIGSVATMLWRRRKARADEHAADAATERSRVIARERVTIAQVEHDARIAPLLQSMIGELREDLRKQALEAEERCRRQMDERDARHEQQRQRDREECDERVASVEDSVGRLTERLIKERLVELGDRHPSLADDDDQPDTGLHELAEIRRTVRRTPTPPKGTPDE